MPSALSSPIAIGWPASTSPTSTPSSNSSVASDSSISSTWSPCYTNANNSCAFPSWPTRVSLSPKLEAAQQHDELSYMPSSFLSDHDLFLSDLDDDDVVPYLDEAPEPPRTAEAMMAQFPLPPLFAEPRRKSQKQEQQIQQMQMQQVQLGLQKKKRRPSKKVVAKVIKMTPIAESPLREVMMPE